MQEVYYVLSYIKKKKNEKTKIKYLFDKIALELRQHTNKYCPKNITM